MAGCLNKIIAKILALRLQKVMNSIIGPQQLAYIKGFRILDSTLITGELIDSCKKNKKEVILKLDFHRAFDSILWGFLDWIMEQMSFPDKWRS